MFIDEVKKQQDASVDFYVGKFVEEIKELILDRAKIGAHFLVLNDYLYQYQDEHNMRNLRFKALDIVASEPGIELSVVSGLLGTRYLHKLKW